MILLGSIERMELQAAIDWWLSPARRVFEKGQSSPGRVSKISWESFTFVDEEGGDEGTDEVRKMARRGVARGPMEIDFVSERAGAG